MSFPFENYFVISFGDLIGIIITILSVILILKQLNDSKLAAQMEGFLTVSGRFSDITPAIKFVDNLAHSEIWEGFGGSEAYLYLTENQEFSEFYYQIGNFYEIISALLRRGALDKQLALDTFGIFGAKRWKILSKAIVHHRIIVNEPEYYTQWEWLAKIYDKH